MKKILIALLLASLLMLSSSLFSQSDGWSIWHKTDCEYITYRVKFKDYKNSYSGEWRWIVEIKNTSDHTINVDYELMDITVQNVKSVCCSKNIAANSTASGI